jgi:hypothetical protein
MIVERGEGKANAAQASRPNAARHFPQIRKHSTPTQHPILYGKAIRKPLRHFGRPENTFPPITMRSERFHET